MKPKMLERPRGFPTLGNLTINERTPACWLGDLKVGRRVLAQLTWNLEGELVRSRRVDIQSRLHGLEREYDAGRVSWQVPWKRGVMHGLAKQFDPEGLLLMTSEFVEGTGVDVFCHDNGELSEFREMRNGKRDGVEFLATSLRTRGSEGFYRGGLRNGVFREWRGAKLQPGFPKYYLADRLVTRAVYRKASEADASLPADDRKDDQPERPVPDAILSGQVVLVQARGCRPQADLAPI